MRTIIFFMILFCSSMVSINAQEKQYQDPQNMPVKPQNTDCQELPSTFEGTEEAQELITATRFYYDQKIKTTRKSGLMEARFVSCDFKSGYLLIRFDGQDEIYPEVSLDVWERFQQSGDIDGFYSKHIKDLPRISGHE